MNKKTIKIKIYNKKKMAVIEFTEDFFTSVIMTRLEECISKCSSNRFSLIDRRNLEINRRIYDHAKQQINEGL